MEGKYIPTATSKARKAKKEVATICGSVSPAVKERIPIEREPSIRAIPRRRERICTTTLQTRIEKESRYEEKVL